MAGCLLIAVYVLEELSYDRYHEHGERIYRMYGRSEQGVRVSTSAALGMVVKRDVSQVEAVVRMLHPSNPVPLIRHGETRFYEDAFYFADPEVLTVFSFPLVQGDPSTALSAPFSVVLSESSANRLFGEKDPIGQVIRFKENLDLTVTGVMRNVPTHSHRRIEFLASFATVERWLGPSAVTDWRRNMYRTYVQLRQGIDPESLQSSLDGIWEEHLGAEGLEGRWGLQPLHRIRLYSQQDLGVLGGGDIREVIILVTVACLVLVVSCLNYSNLATALAARRVREVGLRRSIGAGWGQLAQQYLGESALVTSMAFGVAVVLAEVFAPIIGRMTHADMTIVYAQPAVSAVLAAVLILSTILAGGYPVFRVVQVRPLRALGGSLVAGGSKGRKVMVVGQFFVSVGLLTATAIIYQQLMVIDNSDLGIHTEQILVVPIQKQALRSDPEALKVRVGQIAGVIGVGAAALLPAGPLGRREVSSARAPNDGRAVRMDLLWVDHDVIGTLGMQIVAGEGFSGDVEPRNGYFVLSRKAVQAMGWGSPEAAVGEPLEIRQGTGSGVSPSGTIVGVVEDFRAGSLHRDLQPVVMQQWPWLNYLLIRFRPDSAKQVLVEAETAMAEFDPVHPFEYWFLDDRFARMYESERRLGNLFAGFGGLSLAVACVGLFGLASLAAESRRREFGVRKAMGATAADIGRLLGGEFTTLVLAAGCLASPITYVGAELWLQQFSERVHLGVWVFAGTVAAALLATWLTVAYHAIRVSRIDPVSALRHE